MIPEEFNHGFHGLTGINLVFLAGSRTKEAYFFDSSTMPNTFWVSLNKMDFAETAKPMKLSIAGGHCYAGEASGHFVEAKPFEFMMALPETTKKAE